MAGRSGYVVPADILLVPPRLAGLLVALTDDAASQLRARGMPVPPDWTAWRLDLEDYAARSTPIVVESPEPDVWLDVATVVMMFENAGAPVSARTVTGWARSDKVRARRRGKRAWLLASDDVEAEIDARTSAIHAAEAERQPLSADCGPLAS